MLFKVLACDVLTREVAYCAARSPHSVSLCFHPKGEHDEPARLRAQLQAGIDAVEHEPLVYDAVLLAYGLCGNATAGLQSRSIPLVLPRAHDCTTLFLGSKAAFQEHFGANPSQCWASVGYAERGDEMFSDNHTREHLGAGTDYAALVEQYGEENARFLADALRTEHGSNEVVFIDVPETHAENVVARIHAEAEAQGFPVRTVPGSLRLIQALLEGQWDSNDFLVVPPHHVVVAEYDHDRVLTARPTGNAD